MKKSRLTTTILVVVAIAVLALPGGPALAQEFHLKQQEMPDKKREFSPYVDQHFPKKVLWGDTHFHSVLSFDNGLSGCKLSLEDSLRFGKGEEGVSNNGIRAKLNRPLDFMVLSDHAEYMGIADLIFKADPGLLANEYGKRWYDMFQRAGGASWDAAKEVFLSITERKELWNDPKMKRTVWDRVIDTASKFNEPGKFTVLNGYEWTAAPGPGNNLHRIVIFRDGPERVKTILPFSAFDSSDPEDLWKFMAAYEANTGGNVLAIPHNGNASNGMMFADKTMSGDRLSKAYAESRMRWEPLIEVTQVKGDGEAHPFLSPDDEFADFETWDFGNFAGPTVPKEQEMLKYEYARSALRSGLQYHKKLGVNPFKFGMIGSTDSHIGLSTVREDNWFGKLPQNEPDAERWKHVMIRMADGTPSYYDWQLSASGMIAVWAKENNRESIFDAMERKEVYATTGSRITVRVFAGWDFEADEVERQDFAFTGYSRGVPMGGDLKKAPGGKAPTFMIRAMRDPDNANLDRVQIIKGWLDNKGKTHERIYDVAVSDGRKIGTDGRCKTPVGSTVNVADASYTNTIGDPLLTAFWKDPDFDPKQKAFYYVRVIEIPKPRWTAYDAKFFNVKMPDEVTMTVQDRAYTSPIWYTP